METINIKVPTYEEANIKITNLKKMLKISDEIKNDYMHLDRDGISEWLDENKKIRYEKLEDEIFREINILYKQWKVSKARIFDFCFDNDIFDKFLKKL